MTMAAARFVIAGGTGFIGQALCADLLADGHEVVVLTRKQPVAKDRAAGVRYVEWDPSSPASGWADALRDAEAVINLSGSSIAAGRWSAARKRELLESRTRPAQALIAASAALDRPPRRLLQASGVGYFGTGEAPRADSAPSGADFLAQLAVAWEATLAEAPMPSTALRFGVVLGPGGALPRMLLPFRLFAGGPIGGGQQWLSWIHLTDVVAAIRFAIERELAGPINVTAPTPVRNREFAAIAGRVLRRPAWLPTPALALQLALGEQATLVCEGQQALPTRLLAAGFEFRYPTLEAALLDLCG